LTGALVALAPALVVLLTIAALISAAETAMTAASRGRMHQLEREGDRAAARVNRLIDDQETMIGAILLSNNVFNILASALTTSVLSALFPGAIGVAAATVIMTVLIVVFGEILPKTLALTRADGAARTLSIPTVWVVTIFGPLANGAQWIVRQTLKPFGIKLSMEADVLAHSATLEVAVPRTVSPAVLPYRLTAVPDVDPSFIALPLAELSDAALSRAEQLGCSHAEIRVERLREAFRTFRDHALETTADRQVLGLRQDLGDAPQVAVVRQVRHFFGHPHQGVEPVEQRHPLAQHVLQAQAHAGRRGQLRGHRAIVPGVAII